MRYDSPSPSCLTSERVPPSRELLVRVEAAPALAAEEAGVRHRDEAWGRRHPWLPQLLPEGLARMHVHVDADEVDELAGAHRPACTVLQARVEVGGRDTRPVQPPDGVVQERDQDTVDDEAGRG